VVKLAEGNGLPETMTVKVYGKDEISYYHDWQKHERSPPPSPSPPCLIFPLPHCCIIRLSVGGQQNCNRPGGGGGGLKKNKKSLSSGRARTS